jgi:hypothetical protein
MTAASSVERAGGWGCDSDTGTVDPRKRQPPIARISLMHRRMARTVARFAAADLQSLNRSWVEDPGARPTFP